MKKLLIVISSVRQGRAADKVLDQVQAELKNYPDFETSLADFMEMPLPFLDNPKNPAAPDFEITDANVKKWGELVDEADAVLLLTAEYNHSYTPVLKNAIDWLYPQWGQKPVAFIGYGWVGGARAIKHLRDVFASNIGAEAIDTEANLRFTKEINLDGSYADETAAKAAINSVLSAINQ